MATSSDVLTRSIAGFVATVLVAFMVSIDSSMDGFTISITEIGTKVDNTESAVSSLRSDLKELRNTMYSEADAARDRAILITRLTKLETNVERIDREQASRGPRISSLERKTDTGP